MTGAPADGDAEHAGEMVLAPAAVHTSGAGGAAGGPHLPKKTLADRLRMHISDEIVRGELAPGAVLDEMELARRFQVSRTPVREAIRLLAASGLVDARPHRSAVVARPDRLQVLGMFEALSELEVLCAGFAAERMTKAEHAELMKIHRSLRPVVKRGDPQRYHEVNERFHATIYAGSHNAYLARLTAETRARIAPFSRAQFRTFGRLAQSHAEHERVVSAILRGERDLAAAAMRAHIGYVHEAYAGYRLE
jgi:DNA-binding GntR family transcriptional regulator